VSVVVEGHNESRSLGEAFDILDALERQSFPAAQMDVVLVGRPAEVARWREQRLDERRGFRSIRVAEQPDGASYYDLKNHGASLATGDIVAFADSDAVPGPDWLQSAVDAIEAGADVTMGPSFYHSPRFGPQSAVMQAAASISWGFMAKAATPERCGGFLAHNIVFRGDVVRAHPWPTDRGRTCGALLYHRLVAAGRRMAFLPRQSVAHSFSWRWWLVNLHFRGGFEAYWLRRLDPDYPNPWLRYTGPLEALLSYFWHVLLDVPQWFRYGAILGAGLFRRILLLPLTMALSLVGRGAEACGMAATQLAPAALRRWADGT
jgi:hypothetical protein